MYELEDRINTITAILADNQTNSQDYEAHLEIHIIEAKMRKLRQLIYELKNVSRNTEILI